MGNMNGVKRAFLWWILATLYVIVILAILSWGIFLWTTASAASASEGQDARDAAGRRTQDERHDTDDNSRPYRVYRLRVGETMMLELPGNASTGYRWVIIGREGTSVRIDEPLFYTQPPAPPSWAGAPGFFKTHLTALHPGTTVLYAAYGPAWLPLTSSAARMRIDVQVI